MSLGHAIQAVISRNAEKVRTINRRYAQPRLVMSPTVECAAVLTFLSALSGWFVIYKFITLVV